METPIKAVLFDLDGTLTNTLEDIADAMNRALSLTGLPTWETEAYKLLVGNGARTLAQRAVRDREDKVEEVLDLYQRWYETHNQEKTRPYAGVPELLHGLNERGIPLCVLSNKPDRDTKNVVAHYFPDIPFAAVRGQVEGFPIKPDPAGALLLSRELGIEPRNFAYLGDTKVDMSCAVRAGMQPVGVLWGFRSREELVENGAKTLLEKPEDMLSYLDKQIGFFS